MKQKKAKTKYTHDLCFAFCFYVSFEGLPETSEEGLTLELSAFETLYSGQFEIST